MWRPFSSFSVGAALPFAIQARIDKGDDQAAIARHILWRGLAIFLIGLFLNAYPAFDFAHLRIPGVLQRIALCFAICGLFVLLTRRNGAFSIRIVAITIGFILLTYWALLQFVPVPGFGAPGYDPVGNWPAYVDRTVITVPHMFLWFPVDGKVVFDPEGILSTWPACASVLLGVLTSLIYRSGWPPYSGAVMALGVGCVMIALAYLFNGICPIIKNIWTPTFVLFSGGMSLLALGILMVAVDKWDVGRFLFPVKVFGTNPLLAYLMCFILSPLIYFNWIPTSSGAINLPAWTQLAATGVIDLKLASFLFSLGFLAFEFAVLWGCYRRRWFLRL